MSKLFLGGAAVFGALAVVIGAFGAHALKTKLSPEYLKVYETGVAYHFYHALALGLVGVALMGERLPASCLHLSGWSFVLGILIFSGSLYALSISGIKVFGAITPLGGLSFIVGWIAFLVAVIRSP